MDRVGSPKRLGFREDDAGKWPAVGVVDNERDVATGGEAFQFGEFFIGDEVSAGIGRAGNADRADVGADLEIRKIDVVFESMWRGSADAWALRGEHSFLETLVRIADVFRHERQKNSCW